MLCLDMGKTLNAYVGYVETLPVPDVLLSDHFVRGLYTRGSNFSKERKGLKSW